MNFRHICLKISLLFFGAGLFASLTAFSACKKNLPPDPTFADFPPVILRVGEREENLDFLDAKKYGVAFPAQTLELRADETIVRPRIQPPRVKPETMLIAVTRIETGKAAPSTSEARNEASGEKVAAAPTLSVKQRDEIVNAMIKTLDVKGVRAVQIDFDADVSQRDFYLDLLTNLRLKLPSNVPVSITVPASSCIGDRWLFNAPATEAVPMIFQLGEDEQAVKNYLANGGDFKVKICRQSYGISLDEEVKMNFDKTRRTYFFNSKPWSPAIVAKIEEKFE